MSCCTPEGLIYLRRLLASRSDIAVYPADALEQEEPPEDLYFYRPGEILVRPDQVELFEEAAKRLGLRYVRLDRDTDVTPGRDRSYKFSLAWVPVERFLIIDRRSVEPILVALERESDGRLHASPNHVWFSCPRWQFEPWGNPKPYSLTVLENQHGSAKEARVRTGVVDVAVVDSGLPRDYTANSFLENVGIDPPALGQEEDWNYHDPSKILTSPDGHGTFVAGVVRLEWPEAAIRSYLVLDPSGVVDQHDALGEIAAAIDDDAAVINLSLGGYTRGNQAPLGFGTLEELSKSGGPIVVAAAGNLDSKKVFWPAALEWVVSVGATQPIGDGDVGRAPFSDWGTWVDVWANGWEVISAYEANRYQPADPSSPLLYFDGAATWSGTSFAAPHVAAVIARERAARPSLTQSTVLAFLQAPPSRYVPSLGTVVP